MKKPTIKKPLSLTTTTLRTLQTDQLDLAAGGTSLAHTQYCPTVALRCGTRTCPQ